MKLIVNKSSQSLHSGYLIADQSHFPCAIGRSGFGAIKKEGDGITPIGRWTFRQVFFRPDRGLRPVCSLPVIPLKNDDGWCDEPFDPNYNRFVKLPYRSRSESLWREDILYDIIIVLSHNEIPRVHGAGSAIFMHVAKPGYPATEGCVALDKAHLRFLLQHINSYSTLDICG